jgi:Fe-Mn family superoxide dismutase
VNETHQIPDLVYDHGALEPHISGTIMELHHGHHHAADVRGANQALERLAASRAGESFATLTTRCGR